MSPRVCVAISAYKSDETIKALLETALAQPAIWETVLVVDSLGSGELPRFIEQRGWSGRVKYRNAALNLGSAGNLAARLDWAAELGFDFVFALNHDGVISADVIEQLVRFATSKGPTLGAVFPLRFISRLGLYDMTGKYRLPVPFQGVKARPSDEATKVFWASSNGALYSLVPVRLGIKPWADFWMGWEDLAYGWLLDEKGYDQFVLNTITIDDNYEYEQASIGVRVSVKPAWYAYYQSRNLILAARRTHPDASRQATILARLVLELATTLAFRDSKRKRFEGLLLGLIDGLRARAGQRQAL